LFLVLSTLSLAFADNSTFFPSPGLTPPGGSPCAGWMCPPSQEDPHAKGFVFKPPSFFVGIQVPNRHEGQFFEIESKGNTVLGLERIVHKYPQRGYWVAASEMVSYGKLFDVVAQGWYLIPENHKGSSTYQFAGSALPNSRTWGRAGATNWMADVMVLWSWAPSWRDEGWSQINGFRYDYYSRRLRDPEDLGGFAQAVLPASSSDTVDLTANAFIPYIGIQFAARSSASTAVIAGLLGPVFGTATHEETWQGGTGRIDRSRESYTRSFFFEIQTELALTVGRDVQLGYYSRMGLINGKGEGTLESDLGAGGSQSGAYSMNYRKITYIFGLSLTTAFGSPF